jgi:hypothetical protein
VKRWTRQALPPATGGASIFVPGAFERASLFDGQPFQMETVIAFRDSNHNVAVLCVRHGDNVFDKFTASFLLL